MAPPSEKPTATATATTDRHKRIHSPEPATASDTVEGEADAARAPQTKKPRQNANSAAQRDPEAEAVAVGVDRTAIDIIQALHHASGRIWAIGRCPTNDNRIQAYMDDWSRDILCEEDEMETDNSDDSDDSEDSEYKNDSWQAPYYGVRGKEKKRWILNMGLMKQLEAICAGHCRPMACGSFTEPFKIIVSLPGYGPVGKVLQEWYASATVSGYGDVQEQVTKVDKNIRNAREIPATEFTVPQELVEHIQKCWDEHFFPNTGVRVEPYKIHLYGPGGHFKIHRDTPEKDLVGTFLVGLGDTTDPGQDHGLRVDGKWMKADRGSWCAFYPDVPHSVTEIGSGYRAVIAFKLFRLHSGKETTISKEVRQSIEEVMVQMQPPFGILLSGKYSIGTTEFSGFDALLLTCARKREDIDVHHLPVILESQAEWGSHSRYGPKDDFEKTCSSVVRPFTEAHIDAVLYGGGSGRVDVTKSHPWLKGVKNVPFYSADFDRSTVVCQSKDDETCNYVGNEAQAWSQHSVYLSYALLVLPKADTASSKE